MRVGTRHRCFADKSCDGSGCRSLDDDTFQRACCARRPLEAWQDRAGRVAPRRSPSTSRLFSRPAATRTRARRIHRQDQSRCNGRTIAAGVERDAAPVHHHLVEDRQRECSETSIVLQSRANGYQSIKSISHHHHQPHQRQRQRQLQQQQQEQQEHEQQQVFHPFIVGKLQQQQLPNPSPPNHCCHTATVRLGRRHCSTAGSDCCHAGISHCRNVCHERAVGQGVSVATSSGASSASGNSSNSNAGISN